ncbi:SusC/RagA family TonB-linked outer membrane protein [Dyadobacter sp. 32]|uniref:SusC/RagA family TonB-linked outer membrane protein n=1 Tax=Dyadobacter sp. 32 TaxID=538966 RepID=UPI0011EE5248
MRNKKHLPNPISSLIARMSSLTFVLLLMAGNTFADSLQELLKKQVSLQKGMRSLESVLSEIESKTQVRFSYVPSIISNKQNNITREKQSVEQLLNNLLPPHQLTFGLSGQFIIITKQAAAKSAVTDDSPTATVEKVINGTVKDEKGETLPGVSIIIKGSSKGTTTDTDGNFSIETPDNADVLIFSFVGYTSQEVTIGNQTQLAVTLRQDNRSLDELVVVGYGTQKKVNLTGAVSTVDIGKETESRPITSLSAGLSGLAAGLSINQGSGRPGNDGATIRIRGQGTLNNSNPLVVIDGVIGDMNQLNPQDVETISILKDASSAAIYGSRAANGVVLITTKKGKAGEFKVNYNAFFSSAKPSNVVKTVSNYADYMELMNEGFKNSDPNATPIFSQGKINEWREDAGRNPIKYPNTEWTDEVFKKNMLQNHNISFSGGSNTIRYFGSFGYLNNPGIIERSTYKRYSARVNLETDVKPWLTLGTMLNGIVANTDISTNSIADVFTFSGASIPGMVLRAPDGRFGSPNNPEDDPQANNALHSLYRNKGDIKMNKISSRFYGKLRPMKGLSIEGSFNYSLDDTLTRSQPVFNDRWNFYNNTVATAGTGRTSVTNNNTKNYNYYMDGLIRYDLTVAKHLAINAMVGASQEMYRRDWFSASKMDLIDPQLSVIDAATLDAAAGGNITDWAMRSYFGRINLNWKEKYLFEANLRSDGTSRFAKGSSRWGLFPSFSAGWRISEESFFKVDWLPSLKVRASYGSLGNNSVKNYEYQAVYASANYILNNNLFVGFAQNALSNPALTWESTYITNLGLDFDLFNYKLGGSLELFDKKTKNILINLPAPLVVGNATIPTQNAAEVVNKGIELNLNYRDRIGDFNYRVGGNFTFVNNEVTRFKGKDRTISGTNLLQEGYAINTQYILSVDRMVQTEADMAVVQAMIANAPLDPVTGAKRNPFASYGTPQYGDFLYKDNNGDGIINDDDRVTVGNGTAPRISYGVNLGFDYKGFDFSMLVQGTSGLQVIWHDLYHTTGVRKGYQINETIAKERWYAGRTDATYPRMLNYTDVRNTRASDFWLQNKAYWRLKNIQLGYTLPASITKHAKIGSFRVYGSLENYLTFTKYKGFDPEVNGTQYPTLKQALFGINITF